MHAFDWMIVVGLNGGIIAYGFYLSRGTASSAEWFLGRRSLPWWAIGLSMFATNIDNADLVSICGKTYSSGLHLLSVYAIGSALGAVLAAFAVVPTMYRAGLYTNAEYLEARFGVAARVLSALIQIQYRSTMLGMMLWAVYLLLRGLDIVGPVEAWLLIVGLVLCSGAYTAWGGLKSVVWTDALQGVVMVLGGMVIFGAVWQAVGGWQGMMLAFHEADSQHGTDYLSLTHISSYDGGGEATSPYVIGDLNIGPLVVVLGWTIVGCGYWTVNHTQTMRLMGARSLWDMKMAAMLGVAISLPMTFAMAIMGVLGRSLPDLRNLDMADSIYPRLANEYLGWGWKGIVVASIVAATVSTVDSMGSALSAVFTRDVYARLIAVNRDDQHYVIVGRWATVGVLLLGFLYVPFIALQRNMIDALTTLVPVFVTPLFTVYVMGVFTKAHPRSGVIGLLAGAAYGVCALYLRESPRISWLPDVDGVPLWLTDRWIAFVWAMSITALAMCVVTWWLGPGQSSTRERRRDVTWLERSQEALPAVSEHPFSDAIPWWARPAWYAVAIVLVSFYLVFGVFW